MLEKPLEPESSIAAICTKADMVFDDVNLSMQSHARSTREQYEKAPSMLGTRRPSALSAAVEITCWLTDRRMTLRSQTRRESTDLLNDTQLTPPLTQSFNVLKTYSVVRHTSSVEYSNISLNTTIKIGN